MRPQTLTRLIQVNRPSCIRLIRHNTTTSSPRLTPREADSLAAENFIEKSTSKPAAQLLQLPERDVHTYDTKPPVRFTAQSISTLHARIGLPASFPLETLQRCLTDPSMVEDHQLHNEALSVVGAGLLEYYVTEYLCVRWPRLAMKTQGAALWGYVGESVLARIAREWGVHSQSSEEKKRKIKGKEREDTETDTPKLVVKPPTKDGSTEEKLLGREMEWEVREQMKMGWVDRTGKSLGEWDDENQYQLLALQRFVQALVGGVYVHSDIATTESFIKAHFLSRTLPPLSTLFTPPSPAQHLTRLCERLQIPLPTSRLLAESGRYTRSPIFVVGVFSGREKLGEGQGSSLKEAKVRASMNALRAWYLYEQKGWEFALPSRTEDVGKTYVMGYVEPGSIVI